MNRKKGEGKRKKKELGREAGIMTGDGIMERRQEGVSAARRRRKRERRKRERPEKNKRRCKKRGKRWNKELEWTL